MRGLRRRSSELRSWEARTVRMSFDSLRGKLVL